MYTVLQCYLRVFSPRTTHLGRNILL